MFLENLQELQQLEKEKQALESRLKSEQVKQLGFEKQQILEKQEDVAKLKQELENLKKLLKKTEADLEILLAKKRELSSELYGGKVSNPKELQNIQEQFENLNFQVNKQEDKLLEIEEKKEGMENLLSLEQEELLQTKKLYNRKVTQYKEELDLIKKNQVVLNSRIKELEQEMEEKVLSKYRQLQARLGLTVIVKVDNGFCTGCGVKLHSMALQDLKFLNELITCENCGRILTYYS